MKWNKNDKAARRGSGGALLVFRVALVIYCALHVYSRVTAAFLVPGVQRIAASQANGISPVDFVGGTPLPVLDQG